MGKVAELRRGRSGRAKSKHKGSDDSDEDYMVEEDEDYMIEEDEEKPLSDEEEGEDDGEQYCSDSYNDDRFEEKFEDSGEEEEMAKTARSKRKGCAPVQKKLGTRASNNRKNARKWHDESDDEDQREKFEVFEEKEEKSEVVRSKRRRSLDQKKLHTKASNNRRNRHRETDDEDYNVEAEEDDDEEEEDQTEKFDFSEEGEEISEVNGPKRKRSCLDQKKLRSKASIKRRNGHVEIDDEDYNFEEEEDDEDEEFTLDESVSLEEEDDEEEEEEEEDLLAVKKMKRINKASRRTLRKKSSGSRRKNKRSVKAATSKAGRKRKRSSSLRRKLGSEDDEHGDDFEDKGFINTKRVRRGNTIKKPRSGTRKFTVQSDSDFLDSGPSETEFTISEEEREQVREANKICRDLTVSVRSSCSDKIQDNESFAQRRKPFLKKGKEKVQEVKNEVVKQVCGICFSEEGKNIVRGVLNCCSHYFCFTCIFEWSKVESRCPFCKQRFLTISKPAKAHTGIDLRDVVLQIPERDQVYQPTEEEIRGYLDPYENVICTECHEGGDDELMLLCDLCDSPAHTYCVGLGRDVPEGNWYCDGCRPVSLGSPNSQTPDSLTGQRNLFHRLSSFDGIRDDFDGPLSTPSTTFPQGFGSFPSPRYFGGGIQAPSPRSGTGVVTVSGRRQIHRHIQSMFSYHRTRQDAEVLLGVSANNSQLGEEPQGIPSPQSMQFLPVRSNHSEGQRVLDTSVPGDYIQGTFRPSNISTSTLQNDQPCHFSSRMDVGSDYHLSSSTLGEGSNFFKEQQVRSLVWNYLTSMSSTLCLGTEILEDIAIKSTHTVLAACGCGHNPSEIFPMPPQPVCTHIEDPLMHASPIKGHCNSCFNNFAKEVVKTVMNSRLPPFLHVRN
uniref:Uncharacterized protein n=1 Tax=Kalanchoe fedtschenkoi TaxID=63787 RepID=A0A7N0ZU13_KALFE